MTINHDEITQAVKNENSDYFHQNKDIECLNLAFEACLEQDASWNFTQNIIELGANNFSSILIKALYQKDYVFIDNLFKVKKYINPFEYFRRGRDEQFLDSYLTGMACHKEKEEDKDSPVDTGYLFDRIIKSMPNHTRMHTMPGQMTYYRYSDNYSLKDYAYTYNELLFCILCKIHYPANFDKDAHPDYLAEVFRAVKILGQRSFPLNKINRDVLLRIRTRHPETVAPFDKRLDYGCINDFDDYIFDVDNEFRCTDMAQRKLTIRIKDCDSHELFYQRFRVYLEMARHFKAPHTLNEYILEAMRQIKRHGKEVYQKRMPTMEEFVFLKTLDNSTANHQRLLNFYNRYLHFDRARLHDTLIEKIDEGQEDRLNKI